MKPLATWARRWRRLMGQAPIIPDALWRHVMQSHDFLARLTSDENARLKRIAAHFLRQKRFNGTHGLAITDHIATTVAAHASLPLLNLV